MQLPEHRLNLHQLRVFKVVARHLSFSRAAEELILSQPAVSQHVKQLEKTVGTPLFEKVGRQVFLTEAGQQLYEYGLRIFGLLQETLQVMESLREGDRGNLRIAADTTAGVYVIPDYLGVFRRTHPQVTISLEVTNRTTVIRRLLSREIDLACTGHVPDDEATLQATPFLTNELVVIAAPDCPLVGRRRVPTHELAGETFLMRERGSGTRAAAERFFAAAGVSVRMGMELGSNSAIKQAVANGLGIAVISRHAISLELQAGRLAVLDVEGFPLVRHWNVVQILDRSLPPPAAAFKALLLQPKEPAPPAP